MSENTTTDNTPVQVVADAEEAEQFEVALNEAQDGEHYVTDHETGYVASEDPENGVEHASEEAVEEPKVVRVPRRRKNAQPEAPKVEDKPAARKRGRPAEEVTDPGPRRQTQTEVPADVVGAKAFRRIMSPTQRNFNLLADLREDPIVAGTAVDYKLVFRGTQREALLKRVEAAFNDAKVSKPLDRSKTFLIFLGTDRFGNVDWLIGTKGDNLVRLRESKGGSITFSSITMEQAAKAYDLAFDWDDGDFRYYNLQTKDFVQYNLGKKKADAAKARAEEIEKAAKKAAPRPTAKTAPKTMKVKRITRKRNDELVAANAGSSE